MQNYLTNELEIGGVSSETSRRVLPFKSNANAKLEQLDHFADGVGSRRPLQGISKAKRSDTALEVLHRTARSLCHRAGFRYGRGVDLGAETGTLVRRFFIYNLTKN